jgi:hypothetical protein
MKGVHMVSIESIERGLAKYIDTQIMPAIKTDGIKGFGIGVAASLLVKRGGNLLRTYAQNPMLQQMGLVTADGAVDLEALRDAAKENIPAQGMAIDLPAGISIRITNTDVDDLYRAIREEARV